MYVFPSGFESLESLACLALLAAGIVTGNVLLVALTLAFVVLVHKRPKPRKEHKDILY